MCISINKLKLLLIPLLSVPFLTNCGNTPTVKEHYTITWKRDDGHVLKEDICDKDTLPTYNGADPSYEDARGTHTFDNKWTPDVVLAVKDTTYTAVYTTVLKKYLITFKNDDGSTLTSDTKEYEYGTTPTPATPTSTKTPTAKYQYDFAGWKDEDGNIGLKSVTGVTTYTATYVQALKKYNVSLSSSTGGTITGGGEYPCDSDVTITATPSTGYTFDGWYEGDSSISSEPTYTFKMPAKNISYKAKFISEATYSLALACDVGTVIGAGNYHENDTVTITANYDNPDYLFNGWYEGEAHISSLPTYTFTMPNRNLSYKAKWASLSEYIIILNASTSEQILKLKFGENDTFESINWGDGSTPDTNLEHTYSGTSEKKTYEISIIKPQISMLSLGDSCTARNNVVSINIPSGVVSISDYAFFSCSSLASINIPNSVTSIGCNAFSDCPALASVNIPNNVTLISSGAFSFCPSLISITVASNNSNYDSRDNCNAIIRKSDNRLMFGCKTTIIPSGVTSIDNYAFSECSSLTSINIPNDVTSIGDEAFSFCSSLTAINIPIGVTSIGYNAFDHCFSMTDIYIECEESEKPAGWDDNWLGDCNATLHWGSKP